MKTPHSFRPYQVLCIEHQDQHFYSEMIQEITLRQSYWVRPLALKVEKKLPSKHLYTQTDSTAFYDLRGQSDLILPSALFRAALDTEVVQLLVSIDAANCCNEGDRPVHRLLRDLIVELCQSYPSAFENPDITRLKE